MAKVEAKPETAKPVAKQELLRVDERLMKAGKYEVIPDNTITIDLYLMARNGRWVVIDNPSTKAEKEQVVFRMWTYDEMIAMRKMATAFDPIKRMHMVDNDALNQLKVQKLLVSWTFDKENPRLRIHHVNGVMTDESWGAFTKLQPNIVTCILDEMNRVLEFGG